MYSSLILRRHLSVAARQNFARLLKIYIKISVFISFCISTFSNQFFSARGVNEDDFSGEGGGTPVRPLDLKV